MLLAPCRICAPSRTVYACTVGASPSLPLRSVPIMRALVCSNTAQGSAAQGGPVAAWCRYRLCVDSTAVPIMRVRGLPESVPIMRAQLDPPWSVPIMRGQTPRAGGRADYAHDDLPGHFGSSERRPPPATMEPEAVVAARRVREARVSGHVTVDGQQYAPAELRTPGGVDRPIGLGPS